MACECKKNDGDPTCPCRVAGGIWADGAPHTLALDIPLAGSFALLEGGEPRSTYGLWLWPAGVAMAHEVAARKWHGLSVLELGPGLGLAAMTLARLGAKVTLAEKLPAINVRTRVNLEANHVKAEFIESDWASVAGTFDAIVASETCYTLETTKAAMIAIRRCWNGKGPVLICDPNRPGVRDRLKESLAGLRCGLRTVEGVMRDGRKFECDLWVIE